MIAETTHHNHHACYQAEYNRQCKLYPHTHHFTIGGAPIGCGDLGYSSFDGSNRQLKSTLLADVHSYLDCYKSIVAMFIVAYRAYATTRVALVLGFMYWWISQLISATSVSPLMILTNAFYLIIFIAIHMFLPFNNNIIPFMQQLETDLYHFSSFLYKIKFIESKNISSTKLDEEINKFSTYFLNRNEELSRESKRYGNANNITKFVRGSSMLWFAPFDYVRTNTRILENMFVRYAYNPSTAPVKHYVTLMCYINRLSRCQFEVAHALAKNKLFDYEYFNTL